MTSRMPDAWYRSKAAELYHRGGDVEIDPDAAVSRGDDPASSRGAYVQAWVWVDDPEPAAEAEPRMRP